MNKYQLGLRWTLIIVRGIFLSIVSIVIMTPIYLLSSTRQKKIHKAALSNNLDMLEASLHEGESLDAVNRCGDTALHLAAELGHEKILKALIDLGASLNMTNSQGRTALDTALLAQRNQAANLLIQYGSSSSLLTNILRKDTEGVNNELRHGKNPNITVSGYGTLLHVAAKYSSTEIVEILLAFRAEVNAKSQVGETPLNLAAERGDLSIVQLLIENGAEYIYQHPNTTPLHSAVSKGHIDVVKYLIEHGAKVNARDKFPTGHTPLYLAVCTGHRDIAEFLLINGADVYIKSWLGGLTPLKLAEQNIEIMQVLEKYLD